MQRVLLIFKLIIRMGLFVAAVVLFFTVGDELPYADYLDFTRMFGFVYRSWFLWIIAVVLIPGMLLRIFPNRIICIGARKHFACSYRGVVLGRGVDDLGGLRLAGLHRGAVFSGLGWFVITVLVLLILFVFDFLTPAVVLVFVLFYGVLDVVFNLFYCPFRAFFMRNSCCRLCRIHNWDYLMMCLPLVVFPSVFSFFLVGLAFVVFLRWEISLKRNPHFFMREFNLNLRCDSCSHGGCLGRK